MPLGMPCSQLFGAFQGRSDMFSCSVVAQPEESSATPAANVSKSIFRCFIVLRLENDLVAFHQLILLPFLQDIRHGTVWLNVGDLDPAN